MSAAAMTSATVTNSPVFRSWLLWGAFSVGVGYGFVRDYQLQRKAAAKRERDAKQLEWNRFTQAREAYAASKRGPTSSVISDPDHPSFDLEKLILHWSQDETSGH
jgi:F-type H+-transporting ATP synthase subunit e